MPPRNVFYVLSTHWDREWYQSFQHYRWRLVRLMDAVLDGLEDGRLRGPFQTDGQAIILEDYLEIQPERREQVERFARDGKLVVGPWYVLPDEFIVSGESQLRNLRLGREIARRFGGKPSRSGFACDLFGHHSQLPQLFAGFGIQTAFLWRGINLHDTRHLIWKGADGTELVAYKYDLIGYCDYAFKVRDANKQEVPFDHDETVEKLRKYIDFEAKHTGIEPVLLFDGGDHQEWDQKVYRVLEEAMDAGGKYRIRHTSLDEYADAMLAQRRQIRHRLEGELREPGKIYGKAAHQIHGVISGRVWIKQQNAHCETLLTRWAEPLPFLVHAALGEKYPQGFLDTAWRWLIQNHAHDSICGCSIDQVHEDMKYRFTQAREIAEAVTREATLKVAANIDAPLSEKQLRVALFNAAQVPFDGTAEVELEIPEDYPVFNEFFGFEPKPAFALVAPNGKEIPFQRLSQKMNQNTFRIIFDRFSQVHRVHKVRVALPLSIPAMGYTSLTVRPTEPHIPHRHPVTPGLATSERSMENEHLAVRVESNGTLTLTDKRSGEDYADILTFDDCADIGDGWFHGQAVNDQVFVSSACAADIALVENGKYLTAFRIRTTMRVPREFDYRTMFRSAEFAEVVIDSLVRLRPGQDFLDIETTIHNTAGDHRMRVLMPSAAQAATYLADSPFDVVERPIALRKDNHEYMELEVETRPQQSWTAVFDKKRGLSVIASGLLETAIVDQPARTLALTLFRATRRTVGTNFEPQGQLLGDLRFRYWIRPLRGAPDRVEMFTLAQRLTAGIQSAQVAELDVRTHEVKKKLPASAGLLEATGGAVLTSARPTAAGFEVRLFNPNTKRVTAKISWAKAPKGFPKFRKARLVDFESNPVAGRVTLQANAATVSLKPKQIVTVALSAASGGGRAVENAPTGAKQQ